MTTSEYDAGNQDPITFENATVGHGSIIEPDVSVGFRSHPDCGKATVGKHSVLRKGTIIYGDVSIGDYFLSSYYTVIRAMVKIGNYCALGNHSAIEGIVRMGDGVRVMSHSYIPSRTWIGNHVFIGPGVTFLNDRFPLRREDRPTPQGATIENDVMIGGGVTILPGIQIGERSFIAAGTVVNKDIPSQSLVMGVPARVSPLPDHLNMPNDREGTTEILDIWHPESEYPGSNTWPSYWPEQFDMERD